jgi:hypothetical protein
MLSPHSLKQKLANHLFNRQVSSVTRRFPQLLQAITNGRMDMLNVIYISLIILLLVSVLLVLCIFAFKVFAYIPIGISISSNNLTLMPIIVNFQK